MTSRFGSTRNFGSIHRRELSFSLLPDQIAMLGWLRNFSTTWVISSLIFEVNSSLCGYMMPAIEKSCHIIMPSRSHLS